MTAGDIHTIETEGGNGLLVHANVPSARLKAATGRTLDAANPMQQAGYMESLSERIGEDCGGDHWKEEMTVVAKESQVDQGVLTSMDDPTWETLMESDKKEYGWGRSFEAFCKDPIFKQGIDNCLRAWRSIPGGTISLEDVQLLVLFSTFRQQLAAAVQQARI